MIATTRTAAAAQIDPVYPPGGASVVPSAHASLAPQTASQSVHPIFAKIRIVDESVPKIIINGTVNLFFKLQSAVPVVTWPDVR